MKAMALAMRCICCSLWIFTAQLCVAAEPKTYQATGTVLEVTATTMTIQKGDEKWQFARDKSTKTTVEPKVGAKVTVYYKMIATEVSVKDDSKSTKEKK